MSRGGLPRLLSVAVASLLLISMFHSARNDRLQILVAEECGVERTTVTEWVLVDQFTWDGHLGSKETDGWVQDNLERLPPGTIYLAVSAENFQVKKFYFRRSASVSGAPPHSSELTSLGYCRNESGLDRPALEALGLTAVAITTND